MDQPFKVRHGCKPCIDIGAGEGLEAFIFRCPSLDEIPHGTVIGGHACRFKKGTEILHGFADSNAVISAGRTEVLGGHVQLTTLRLGLQHVLDFRNQPITRE